MESNKSVKINTKEIIDLVKQTAFGSYGVANIATKDALLSNANANKQTKKGKKEDAIFVKVLTDNTFTVDVYLVISLGIKITEAISECQKAISYALKKKYKASLKGVNVYAESISSSK